MQTHATPGRKRLKELFEQLGVHLADLVALEFDMPDEIRPTAEVYRGPAKCLVHRQIGMAKACNAAKIAQGLGDRLAKDNTCILDRMVHINMQVPNNFDIQVDRRMFGETLQHMIEKADACIQISFACSVQINGQLNGCFFRFALNLCRSCLCHSRYMTFRYMIYHIFCSYISKQFALKTSLKGKIRASRMTFLGKTKKQDGNKPPALGYLVPRWVAISCVAFWLSISALLITSFSNVDGLGIALMGLLALCSSGIVIYLGVLCVRKLQIELHTLARLARKDQSNMDVTFAYSEFSDIATEINAKNHVYRDEMETLRLAAYRDAVTGLPNRLNFTSAMKKVLKSADQDHPCAVMHLIIDGFQSAGDMLGTTGNQRLQADAASRLSLYLASMTTDRETNLRDLFLASLGAGQFGILMPTSTTRKAAADLVRELHQVFEEPFNIDGRDIKVTISGGLAMGPEDGDLPEILLKNASLALNEVLRAGKVGFQFFSPRLERIALGRTRFEQELRDAVAEEAFHPVFQPKIDLKTQKVIGVEALARWKRSEGRMISPGTFIPLAEELGLIDEIGFQILRQSCKAAAGWLKDGMQISVAVNVSPRQFDRLDFVDQIVEALRVANLPPQYLELEITETMAVSNPDRVINVMKPLRAMGIKLAVDDFGTGHANLSLLTQIPFDTFKIDRQFVMGIGEDDHSPAIVEMTLAMAKTLGLRTVAEGIETEAQAKFLKDRGCHLAQGFLYSPGIPDQEFRELMTKWGQNPSAKQRSA